MNKKYYYFVEEECEKRLVDLLKGPAVNTIVPGKASVFNIVQKRLSDQRIMVLDKNAVIVLIYDVDVKNTDLLEFNIKRLNECGFKNIIHIQSIRNFEEEIIFSSSIKDINEVFGSKGIREFKNRFIAHKNLSNKLEEIGFNVNKLWSRENKESPFNKYSDKELNKLIKTRNN